MKILLIDYGGNFLSLALRCRAAGHEVKWFISPRKDGSRSCVGDGYFKKLPDWEPAIDWADLIVLSENSRYITQLEPYRREGYPIFGSNVEGTEWELDRGIGQQVFKDAGITTIPTWEFTNYNEAIAFVKENPKRYVSKPSGDADKSLSYVAKSARDMVFMLEYWQRTQRNKAPFILQDFIPGVEMAVGGWFGRDGWVGNWVNSFEFKKFMNDDKGPNTGEMGSVVYCPEQSLLADKVLKPLTPQLIRMGYTGYIDVNCMIDKTGTPYPMEFTARRGWPLDQILLVLQEGDPAKWMLDALNGKDTLQQSEEVAVGVVIAQPDFPYNKLSDEKTHGYPIWGVNRRNTKHIHLSEAQWGLGLDSELEPCSMPVTAGTYIAVVTGKGLTVSQAKEAAYANVSSLEIPNSIMYRTDIGNRLKDQLPQLEALGYTKDVKF